MTKFDLVLSPILKLSYVRNGQKAEDGREGKAKQRCQDVDESILATCLLKIWVTAVSIKQARAFGSELLKARDLQRQLQTSIRKPLKWLTYSFEYDCGLDQGFCWLRGHGDLKSPLVERQDSTEPAGCA
jgi:hypothetical protein